MKRIEVEIEGTSPLLMHSAQAMVQQTAKKNPANDYDNTEEAEKVAYRNGKGELYVPSRCLKGAMLNGASWFKFGKKSAKQIIAGCTKIEPIELKLTDLKGNTLKDYVIDLRPVVIQRNRIIRARPKLDEWKLSFILIYDEQVIGSHVDVLRSVIEEAGRRIGILDNRPQKYGENGGFKVTKFMPVK